MTYRNKKLKEWTVYADPCPPSTIRKQWRAHGSACNCLVWDADAGPACKWKFQGAFWLDIKTSGSSLGVTKTERKPICLILLPRPPPLAARSTCMRELALESLANQSPSASTKATDECSLFRRKRHVIRSTIKSWHRVYLDALCGSYPSCIGSGDSMTIRTAIPPTVHADAELTHVPRQDCPISKPSKIQHRQGFARSQTGSVKSQQLGQFGVGANSWTSSWGVRG
jgi:hypothetical protein